MNNLNKKSSHAVTAKGIKIGRVVNLILVPLKISAEFVTSIFLLSYCKTYAENTGLTINKAVKLQ